MTTDYIKEIIDQLKENHEALSELLKENLEYIERLKIKSTKYYDKDIFNPMIETIKEENSAISDKIEYVNNQINMYNRLFRKISKKNRFYNDN